jgi:hypothetical protein
VLSSVELFIGARPKTNEELTFMNTGVDWFSLSLYD